MGEQTVRCPHCGESNRPIDKTCWACDRELRPAVGTDTAQPAASAASASQPLPPIEPHQQAVQPPPPAPMVPAPPQQPGPPQAQVNVVHQTSVGHSFAAGLGLTTGCLTAIVLFVVVGMVGCGLVVALPMIMGAASHGGPATAPAEKPPEAPVMAQYQWADIERLVNDPNATEIQRQETAKQLAGAWVQMTGQVDDVSSSSYDSGLSVSMKCGAQSLLSDTWVEMRPDQKDVLLQYTKGSTLTVIARFKSHDSFGHRYTDGKVIR